MLHIVKEPVWRAAPFSDVSMVVLHQEIAMMSAPPYGVKQAALCWQDSATAGDAQCTFDCVNVTASNGSIFYPVGCSFTITNTTAPPSSVSLNLPTAASTPPSSTNNAYI
ncbi:hypothetical protein B7463_g12730, partial [Scytalidium lignicola]